MAELRDEGYSKNRVKREAKGAEDEATIVGLADFVYGASQRGKDPEQVYTDMMKKMK